MVGLDEGAAYYREAVSHWAAVAAAASYQGAVVVATLAPAQE